MIRKNGYETSRAAEIEALSLINEYRYKENLRSEEVETETNKMPCSDGAARPYYVKDKETGALAAITAQIANKEGDLEYNVIFMEPEEADADNRTYPFRDIIADRIPFILAMRVSFFKPLTPIPADEALTAEAAVRLNAFFIPMFGNLDGLGTEEEIEGLTKELAVSENKSIFPFPDILAQITGGETDNVEKYIKSLSELLGGDFNEAETEELTRAYIYKAADHLRKWITYELFRTENYSHLKETVIQARKMLSPYEDSEDAKGILGTEEDDTATYYAISKYLGKDANFARPERALADIAEYIEAPVEVVCKANTIIEY